MMPVSCAQLFVAIFQRKESKVVRERDGEERRYKGMQRDTGLKRKGATDDAQRDNETGLVIDTGTH